MEFEFDPVKRDATLRERGFDFAEAPLVFEGVSFTVNDARYDYGETRWRTYGWLKGMAVAVVWIQRGEKRRIISMRRMHDEEIENVGLDGP